MKMQRRDASPTFYIQHESPEVGERGKVGPRLSEHSSWQAVSMAQRIC